MNQIKKIIKTIIPKPLLNFTTRFFYGWSGNYSTWQAANSKCSGYDSQNILETVKQAALKVKNDQAIFERDSVIFDKVVYSFPVLSGLMWIAAQNHGNLSVLDFGGSLGSSYYQNREFLKSLSIVSWCVVEQPNFVVEGQRNFSNDVLKFYDSIDKCLNENQIDVILLSSVLQYIEKPYDLLDEINLKEIKYIIIDRTGFINGNDRITRQKVHPAIYKATYPCWFFNESKLLDYFKKKYELIFSFDSFNEANISSEFKGFIFKKI